MKIPTNLDLLRQRKGVSQREVSRQTGIHHQHISEMEKGIRIPTLEQVELLCKYFNTSFDFLYPNPVIREALSS